MTYQLTNGSSILRLTDNAFIPPDPANRDYAEYLAWLEEGNEPLPTPEPPPQSELTIEEKLSSVGLSIEDLKKALGL